MKRKNAFVICITMILALSGCGKMKTELVPVTMEPYERMAYSTIEAMKGDITPRLELKLSPVDKRNVSYNPPYDGIKVSKVHVEEGDFVKEGDKLISFKSDESEKQLIEYQDELEMQKLLLEHYEKLAQTDKGTDYKDDIEMLKKDMAVTSLYIAEINEKMDAYTIKAEGNGVIEQISELVNYEKVDMRDKLIYVVYNTGEYSVTCMDSFDFKLGETYRCTYRDIPCEMELYDMKDANKGKELFFRAKDMKQIILANFIDLVIEKTSIEDTYFLPREAIIKIEDKSYVFLINQEGFREPKEVEIGAEVDGNVIIKSGINAGDKVVIIE